MALIDWILRRRRDEDLDAELRAHLSLATQDRIEHGEDARSARLGALREFGNVTLTREATRRSWGGAWRERVADLLQDVRYSIRVLSRSPGYSLVVIAVLALGIGANVSVFRLFKAVGLEPLPAVDGSAGLGVLVARTGAGRIVPLSHPDFRDIRKEQRAFDGLAGAMMDAFSLGLTTHGERVFGELVTGNYFSVLGVGASLGRTLQESDDVAPGQHPVVVISDGLWRRAFASDPAIVGRTVQINAYPFTVVGVAEPGFQGSVVGVRLDVFMPVMMQPQLRGVDLLASRQSPMVWGIGHLRSDASFRAASEEATSLSRRIDAQQPAREVEQHAAVIPMWQSPFGAQTYMLPAIMLMGVMGALLLLIVCANVSNLVLVRGVSRRGEIAARLALGASRGRIMRLLFVESAVLSLPGAAFGLLTAQGISRLLNDETANAASQVPIALNTSLDWTVVAFAVLISCASSLIFGFVPALRSSQVDLAGVMKDDLSPRGGSRGRLRGVLVASQVAVSLLLLVGAALVMRSLEAARNANVGFDERQVAVAMIELKSSGYDEGRGRAFYERLLDTLRAQPGNDSVALASVLPLTLVDNTTNTTVIEGRTAAKGEDMRFLVNTVSPDYLSTLRIPLIAGRDFTQNDRETSLRVAMINETMARRFWGSPDAALGNRIRVGGGQWRTIVGVARDIKYARVTEEPRPHVYLAAEQNYWSAMVIHLRSRDAEPVILARLRSTIQALDPSVPILRATMLRDQTRAALSIFTMAAGSLMTFGIIAMILTALGTYGLVSYAARQSTHEIGIRIAIGADRQDLLRRFLSRGLRLGAAGAVCGCILSLVIARLLSSLLYGVSPTDAVSFSAALALVMTIVLVASLVPAWRASRTDPIAALRHR
jgi:macrolide transport system ATP-binding/permease protein